MITLGHGGLPHPVHDARFYEGVGVRRLLAFFIDLALATALGALVPLAFGGAAAALGALFGSWAATGLGAAAFGATMLLMLPVILAIGFVYRVVSIALWSATPGMLALGVEFRRFDGERFGPAEALIHTGLFTAMCFFVVPQILNVGAMATLPMGRGLGDLALGSAVIHRPA